MSDINSFTDADVAIVFRHLVDSRQSHSNTVIESVLVAFQLNDKFRDTLVNTLRQAHLLSSNYQVNQIMDRLDALQNWKIGTPIKNAINALLQENPVNQVGATDDWNNGEMY